jgi:hypothetical protein
MATAVRVNQNLHDLSTNAFTSICHAEELAVYDRNKVDLELPQAAGRGWRATAVQDGEQNAQQTGGRAASSLRKHTSRRTRSTRSRG